MSEYLLRNKTFEVEMSQFFRDGTKKLPYKWLFILYNDVDYKVRVVCCYCFMSHKLKFKKIDYCPVPLIKAGACVCGWLGELQIGRRFDHVQSIQSEKLWGFCVPDKPALTIIQYSYF